MSAWLQIIEQHSKPIKKSSLGRVSKLSKQCIACREELPIEDFYPKADGKHFRFASQCKPCQLVKHKEKRARARNKKLRIAAI